MLTTAQFWYPPQSRDRPWCMRTHMSLQLRSGLSSSVYSSHTGTSASPCLERQTNLTLTYRLEDTSLLGCDTLLLDKLNSLTLKKAVQSFETMWTTHPATISRPRKQESSATLWWEPQFLQNADSKDRAVSSFTPYKTTCLSPSCNCGYSPLQNATVHHQHLTVCLISPSP